MENMDVLPLTAPSLVFARETYTPYTRLMKSRLPDNREGINQKSDGIWAVRVD